MVKLKLAIIRRKKTYNMWRLWNIDGLPAVFAICYLYCSFLQNQYAPQAMCGDTLSRCSKDICVCICVSLIKYVAMIPFMMMTMVMMTAFMARISKNSKRNSRNHILLGSLTCRVITDIMIPLSTLPCIAMHCTESSKAKIIRLRLTVDTLKREADKNNG